MLSKQCTVMLNCRCMIMPIIIYDHVAKYKTQYLHSLFIFCRKKIAFNLCIARRSGTASRAWHLLSINPLTGRTCLAKFGRARVSILFDCLQSFLDGSWKASLFKLLKKNKQKNALCPLRVLYIHVIECWLLRSNC